MPFIAIALVVAAAIGGGTSLAAQNALPGNPLWNFKVAVNENIQAALAAEGKAQAEFDIAAIEARLNEARELAAQARLSADAQADLETNFEKHSASVAQQITKMHADGDFSAAADIAARFQAALATGGSALADANVSAEAATEASAQAKANVQALLGKVHGTLQSASDISAQASIKAAANANTNAQVSNGQNPDSSVSSDGSVQSNTNVDVNVGGSGSSGASGGASGSGGIEIGL